jgi:hypothetical protein
MDGGGLQRGERGATAMNLRAICGHGQSCHGWRQIAERRAGARRWWQFLAQMAGERDNREESGVGPSMEQHRPSLDVLILFP